MTLLQPDDSVLDLFRALDGFHRAYWRSSHEPLASRAVSKLRQPLVEVVGLAVVNVLEEMRSGLSDPNVQSVGVSFLRAALHESSGTTKDIIQRAGVVEVLVRSMTSHATTEHLLSEGLAVLDELHGLQALLQALEHLRSSPAASKAALVTFRTSARARWYEVERLNPVDVIRVILLTLRAHQDPQVILVGLQLLGDLAGDLPETRSAFFNLGGWDWLLHVLESAGESFDHLEIQQEGIRMVSQLCKGGACGDAFVSRVEKVLERCLQRSQHDGKVLYWGLWAVQQLHGVKSLLGTLQNNCLTFNDKVVKSTLRSLSDLSWEGDVSLELVVEVIRSVIYAMRICAEQDWDSSELLNDGAFTLGKVAATAALEKNEGIPQVREAALVSSSILLELLNAKVADAQLCRTVLEALGDLLEVSGTSSTVRARICQGLFNTNCNSPGCGVIGAGLLSKVSAEHVSNTKLQGVIMWLAGVAHGVAAIVAEMSMNQSCYGVQIAALRATQAIFDQLEHHSDSKELASRGQCIVAALAAMSSFPENLAIWAMACYALNAIVQHGVDQVVQKEQILSCLQAAAKALSIAQNHERHSYGDEAPLLREEAVKLIAVCVTTKDFGVPLADCKVPLAHAMEAAVERLEEDPSKRAEEVEVLVHNLIALVYVSGPEEILVGCLQRWGAKTSLVRACSQVVAELVRRNTGVCEELLRGPVRAELVAAAQVHKDDAELQSSLELAFGFLQRMAPPFKT